MHNASMERHMKTTSLKRTAVRTAPSLAATCAAALLLAGCNTANTTRPTGPAGADGSVPYKQIVTNGWLKYKANIVGVREGVVNGDMKRVAVDVYSDQLTTQRFSYRFDWTDSGGMPVASATSSMTSVTIKPKETITLTAVAPAPSAVEWRLTFLDAQY